MINKKIRKRNFAFKCKILSTMAAKKLKRKNSSKDLKVLAQ